MSGDDENVNREGGVAGVGGALGEASEAVRRDAEKAYGEVRGRGAMGFFSFDFFYFPIVARYLFIILVILSVVGIFFGVLGGVLTVVTGKVLNGIGVMVGAVVVGVAGIFLLRLWFEMFLLGFKMYEGIKNISDKCAK